MKSFPRHSFVNLPFLITLSPALTSPALTCLKSFKSSAGFVFLGSGGGLFTWSFLPIINGFISLLYLQIVFVLLLSQGCKWLPGVMGVGLLSAPIMQNDFQ